MSRVLFVPGGGALIIGETARPKVADGKHCMYNMECESGHCVDKDCNDLGAGRVCRPTTYKLAGGCPCEDPQMCKSGGCELDDDDMCVCTGGDNVADAGMLDYIVSSPPSHNTVNAAARNVSGYAIIPCQVALDTSEYGVQMSSCAGEQVWQASAVPASAGRYCANATGSACSRYSLPVASSAVQLVGMAPFATTGATMGKIHDCVPAVMEHFPAPGGGLPPLRNVMVTPQTSGLLSSVPTFQTGTSAVMNVNSAFNAWDDTVAEQCRSRSALNTVPMSQMLCLSYVASPSPCPQGQGAWVGAATQSVQSPALVATAYAQEYIE